MRLEDSYSSALREYLDGNRESALRAAYELGREAVREKLSMLDLASIHHAALTRALQDPDDVGEVERVTRAAGDLFMESLSTFEMVQRGFWEATERARLDREHASHLRRLAEASLALNSTLSLEGILDVLTERSRELVGAHCAMATVFGEERQADAIVVISCSADRPYWGEVLRRADVGQPAVVSLRSGRALRVEVHLGGLWRELHVDREDGTVAGLAAGLTGREGRALGLIQVFDKEQDGFSEADELLLEQLAHTASVAIQNAKLYSREHLVAETLQRGLLPVRLPPISGLELAARYISGATGTQVGGDWYDVVVLPDGRVGVAIGDVLGRGPTAASVMGQVRTAFRAYALGGATPEVVVKNIDALTQAIDIAHFSTMIYLVLDPSSGRMRMVRAGHPPPLLVTPDGLTGYLEADSGIPLGVTPAYEYDPVEETLASGSILVLYTDGLVELESGLKDGMERLEKLVQAAGWDPEALCDRVLQEMVGGETHDDVALLVLRLERDR